MRNLFKSNLSLDKVFAALADSARRSVLQELLAKRHATTGQLAKATGVTSAAISKHLAILKKAGLIHHEKYRWHSLNERPIRQVNIWLAEFVDRLSKKPEPSNEFQNLVQAMTALSKEMQRFKPLSAAFKSFYKNSESRADRPHLRLQKMGRFMLKGKTRRQDDMTFKDILQDIVDELDEREKLVFVLYYWENLTLREISEILDVTQARVCQIHTRVLLRLREKLHQKMAIAS